MGNATKTFTQTTFAEEIASADKPVLVDFWAEWCGPCKAIAPILDEIAEENSDRLTVAKVNVDNDPDIAMQFQVMGIPTLIMFKDGVVVDRVQGAAGKAALLELVDAHA